MILELMIIELMMLQLRPDDNCVYNFTENDDSKLMRFELRDHDISA